MEQDSDLQYCRCQGKEMAIRTTPINEHTEKAVLEGEETIFVWSCTFWMVLIDRGEWQELLPLRHIEGA